MKNLKLLDSFCYNFFKLDSELRSVRHYIGIDQSGKPLIQFISPLYDSWEIIFLVCFVIDKSCL